MKTRQTAGLPFTIAGSGPAVKRCRFRLRSLLCYGVNTRPVRHRGVLTYIKKVTRSDQHPKRVLRMHCHRSRVAIHPPGALRKWMIDAPHALAAGLAPRRLMVEGMIDGSFLKVPGSPPDVPVTRLHPQEKEAALDLVQPAWLQIGCSKWLCAMLYLWCSLSSTRSVAGQPPRAAARRQGLQRQGFRWHLPALPSQTGNRCSAP